RFQQFQDQKSLLRRSEYPTLLGLWGHPNLGMGSSKSRFTCFAATAGHKHRPRHRLQIPLVEQGWGRRRGDGRADGYTGAPQERIGVQPGVGGVGGGRIRQYTAAGGAPVVCGSRRLIRGEAGECVARAGSIWAASRGRRRGGVHPLGIEAAGEGG
ncbi:hypothetical protein THAOC_20092, partial [Thalassiosira oceanica]